MRIITFNSIGLDTTTTKLLAKDLNDLLANYQGYCQNLCSFDSYRNRLSMKPAKHFYDSASRIACRQAGWFQEIHFFDDW